MITNKDLTAHQIALLSVTLEYEIARLDECLAHSVKLNMPENEIYYNKRKSEIVELRDIICDTVGMKTEICK